MYTYNLYKPIVESGLHDLVKVAYKEAQNKWVKHYGVSVGTRVKITNVASDYAFGWCGQWNDKMSELANMVGIVNNTAFNEYGIQVTACDVSGYATWYFPFFVLEVIKEQSKESFTRDQLVLCRQNNDDVWCIYSFLECEPTHERPYKVHYLCGTRQFKQCIDYNKHADLIGSRANI